MTVSVCEIDSDRECGCESVTHSVCVTVSVCENVTVRVCVTVTVFLWDRL